METKATLLKHYISRSNWKQALRIFKTFRLSLDRQSKRIVDIAYECHTGKERFYQSLGIDTMDMKIQAIALLQAWANR